MSTVYNARRIYALQFQFRNLRSIMYNNEAKLAEARTHDVAHSDVIILRVHSLWLCGNSCLSTKNISSYHMCGCGLDSCCGHVGPCYCDDMTSVKGLAAFALHCLDFCLVGFYKDKESVLAYFSLLESYRNITTKMFSQLFIAINSI